jgi:tetratricopeptide (TPR) repeat protein
LDEVEEEQVELRLLSEPQYSEELDLEVEDIIEQYVSGEFAGDELERVRQYFFRSEVRQEQLRFALALEAQKSAVPAEVRSAATVSQLRPKTPWFTPYVAIAATLLVALGLTYYGLYQRGRSQSHLDEGLVALNTAYRQERPVEARLSDLNYAPFPNQRSGGTPANVDYVQRDRARELLQKEATEKPGAAAHRALGQFYLAQKQFDDAINEFNAALAVDPNDAKSHIDLGAALLEKGKSDPAKASEHFSRSLEHLNKGLQLDSSSLEGLFNRALVYEYMKRRSEAVAAWREYLQKDPGSRWAEEAETHLKF